MQMHESLVDFAFSMLQSIPDAEETVSDFFIVIWQRRALLGAISSPKLYIFTGIKNTALNRLRVRKRRQLPPVDEWQTALNSVFFNPEELLLTKEIAEKIMTAVNQLPPKCRTIFKLVKERGLKYAEVASLLDLSVKTVEAQMSIALRRIRSHSEFKTQFPELHSLLSKKK